MRPFSEEAASRVPDRAETSCRRAESLLLRAHREAAHENRDHQALLLHAVALLPLLRSRTRKSYDESVRELAIAARDTAIPTAFDCFKAYLSRGQPARPKTRISVLLALARHHALSADMHGAIRDLALAQAHAGHVVEHLAIAAERVDILSLFEGRNCPAIAMDAILLRELAQTIDWQDLSALEIEVLPLAAQALARLGESREALKLCAASQTLCHGERLRAYTSAAIAFALARRSPIDAAIAAKSAYAAYVHLGYEWRAARISLLLERLTGKQAWAERATFHLRAYPNAPLAATILPGPTLTPRQRQIVACMRRGDGSKAICSELGITQSTLRHHYERIYRRFGVHSRADLRTFLLKTQVT